MKDRDELLIRYLWNLTDEEETRAVHDSLREDPAAGARLAELSLQQSLLVEMAGSERERTPDVTARSVPRRRRVSWGVWVSVAACLVIVAGAALVNEWRTGQMPEMIVARIQESSPGVRIHRNGTSVVAVESVELFAGDRMTTGKTERVTFAYENEDTRIEAYEETRLEIGPVGEGKRLEVSLGRIRADVAPQPEGKPMVVTTPHAKAEVVGTVFTLAVDTKTTRLNVVEGSVRFTDISSGSSTLVAAGQSATAGEDVRVAEGRLLSIRIPGDDEVRYATGRTVFEDDFEENLGNWELVQAAPGKLARFRPAGRAAKALVRIEERTRAGRKTQCLVVDVPGNSKTRVGIRLKDRVKSPAYAIEWDSCHETPGTKASPVCPGATDYQTLYDAPAANRRIRVRTWFRRRIECRPIAEIDGRTWYEIRSYIGERLTDRIAADFSHGTFVLDVSAGRAAFDNFVIRELVREDKSGGEKKETGTGS